MAGYSCSAVEVCVKVIASIVGQDQAWWDDVAAVVLYAMPLILEHQLCLVQCNVFCFFF